jgi:hypothetical protein
LDAYRKYSEIRSGLLPGIYTVIGGTCATDHVGGQWAMWVSSMRSGGGQREEEREEEWEEEREEEREEAGGGGGAWNARIDY